MNAKVKEICEAIAAVSREREDMTMFEAAELLKNKFKEREVYHALVDLACDGAIEFFCRHEDKEILIKELRLANAKGGYPHPPNSKNKTKLKN
jgi:hypothetical protein